MAHAAAPEKTPLDDVMMAMDVVDTLRHGEKLVERELSGEARRRHLIDRLRGIYESQGITVTDRILAEGVDALEEERFVYKPKRGGFAFVLARLYVRRGVVVRNVAIGFTAFVVATVVWFFLIEQPRQQRLEDQQQAIVDLGVELGDTIPADLERLAAAIAEEANDAGVATAAAVTARDGVEAAAQGEAASAREAVAELQSQLNELRTAFDVRVVSRPGVLSGVFRIPAVNETARNYYLIVEAIGPDGITIERAITSEEDGTIETVSIWGARVSEAVYNAAVADKQDDGIIQNDFAGEKIRGDLEITWLMDALGGAITDW
jgi:hypothetical protein